MTSFAYRLGRGTHKAVNVVAAGSVVVAAGAVQGTKVAAKATGQFGSDFVEGYASEGGVRDQLNAWFKPKVEAHREQPKRRTWDVNGNLVDG